MPLSYFTGIYNEFLNDRSNLKTKYDSVNNDVQKQAIIDSIDEIIKSYVLFKQAVEKKVF